MSDPVQIRKALMIIKASKTSLITAEQFLRNREWSVFSTVSLKDALTYIVQNKPTFVMVCIDHPNKKIRTLPKLLVQAFPVCVIAYADQSSTQSYRMLMDSATEYKVNPPVTGPAVERAVNKYIRDLEKAAIAAKETKTGAVSGPPSNANPASSAEASGKVMGKTEGGTDIITFKGDSQGAGGAFSLEKMNQILSNIGGAEGADDHDAASEDQSSSSNGLGGAAYRPDVQAPGQSEKGPAYMGGAGDPSSNPGGDVIDLSRQKKASAFNGQKTVYTEDEDMGGSAAGSQKPAGFLGPDPARAGASDEDFSQDPGAGRGPGYLGSAGSDKKGSGFIGQAPTGKIQAREVDEEAPKIKNPEAFHGPIQGPRASLPKDSIIVKGSQQALEETVEIRDGTVEQNLDSNTNVACILIESNRFSGYLVTAMGKNRKIDNHFLKTVQERLFKFLKDAGEDLSDKENMQMKIKKVDFEDWALEYAEFLRKSVHKGDEVAMAFFPRADASVQLKDSAASEMGAVSINEIEADKPVECNLYVYLPANNKYVLYTPKGGTFYGDQKARLEKQGVKDLHILKAEVQDMTKYKAQNYLNNLIDNFQSQQNKTKMTGS